MDTREMLHASGYADRAESRLAGGAAPSVPGSGGGDVGLKRGRLLVGVAALVAGALAKASERVAAAADGDPLVLGRTNTATSLTVLRNEGGATGIGGLSVSGPFTGVSGSGIGGGSIGVSGRGMGGSSTGVSGSGIGGSSIGVSGRGMGGNSTGVIGSGSTGVIGSGSTGVVGRGMGGDSTGVIGSGSTGVVGRALLNGIEVLNGIGVRGQANSGPAAKGVVGVSRDGFAGYFQGKVFATDSVTTEGTLSIAARQPDGTRRRLDALASPLSYFQDFGQATLVRGRARVPLDPDFAALVQTDDYLVFLTPEGRTRGLFVFSKSPTEFEVRDADDDQGGDAREKNKRPGVPFVWQVVARRRNTTAAAARLEPLAVPTPVPELPKLPPIPELPSVPEPPEVPQAAP